MAEQTKLTLNDLAESLMLSRGHPLPAQSPARGNVPADKYDIQIFDALNKASSDASRSFYSTPGGPDETGMKKPYPKQSLSRYNSVLDEIVALKAAHLLQLKQSNGR